MEIYNKYKRLAHSDDPTIDKVFWQNLQFCSSLSKQFKSEPRFLSDLQKNTSIEARLTIAEIQQVIDVVDKNLLHGGALISKVVIQKSKVGVSTEAKLSGCWTNLAFLYRDDQGGTPIWYMYAFLRARFKLQHLQLESKDIVALGYTHFISISDKEERFSIE